MATTEEKIKVTDFEKAWFIADKLRNYKGVRRFTPEEILGRCRTSAELDMYYYGLRDIIDSYSRDFYERGC